MQLLTEVALRCLRGGCFQDDSKEPQKSSSLDPVPTYFLMKVLPPLLPIITTIINHSLESGIFPDSMKAAQVMLLLKTGRLTANN